MTSLYNRATPLQTRILRVVEGCIRDAAQAHPDRIFDPRLAKSIAKRVAGTLSAQWADMLAASAQSDRVASNLVARHDPMAGTLGHSVNEGARRPSNGALPLGTVRDE